MKNIYKAYCFLSLCLLVAAGCSKDDTEFKKFLKDGEIVYPGKAATVITKAGNLRAGLWWNPSPDPSISKYVVYWNNNADSVVVNATTHDPLDTVKVIIPDLKEYSYTFTVFSYDKQGHRSVPVNVSNVRVFGPLYQSGLLNRPYNATDPYLLKTDGSLQLNFNVPDTINISTVIKYVNKSDVTIEKQLGPKVSSILLPDYKLGTDIQYKSSYIPEKGALDIFQVTAYSVFPKIFSLVMCDKSLFKEYVLPNDVGTLDESPLRKLWDGSQGPQDYPNIFHSKDNVTMPHTITFDMGKVYTNLGVVEETGRSCCHNPDQFEIWGIADITNAATTLPASNAGWKDEAIAKGWVLLKDVIRTDDGQAAMKFELMENPPPVRYIRIRIKHTANGNTKESNMSEITFWNKQ